MKPGNISFSGVDFTKFIMAIFVVAIHTNPFIGINNIFTQIWDLVIRFAVPYFFIASGFFLFLKLNKEQSKSGKLKQLIAYLRRIIKLYAYWTLIFLPITIWKFVNNEYSFYDDILLFIRGVFFIGENFYSWPLWYLLSMIYSLIFIYFLIRFNVNFKGIFIIAILLFFVAILINKSIKYEGGISTIKHFGKVLNIAIGSGRLFIGMLYIVIGGFFSNYNKEIPRYILLTSFFIGLFFQIYKLDYISNFTFLLLPIVIFYLSKTCVVSESLKGYFFRKSSTIMYFLHMIILFIYTLFFKEFVYYGWDAFVICVLVPILLTPLILKNEDKIKILKKIF